jgi:thymidylate kinase
MAKIIIFEGIERCSKTSMISLLDGVHGVKMDPGNKQPDNVELKDLGLYYEGMHQFALKFLKLTNESFLIDRFFLSELAYAEKFNRSTYMNLDYIQELCKDNTVVMFFMKNTYQDYINRGPKNKIRLTADVYRSLNSIFKKYLEFLKLHVDNLIVYEIETSNKTIPEIHENITTILDEEQTYIRF